MTDQGTLFSKDAVLTLSTDIVCRKNEDGSVIVMKMDDSDIFYKIDGIAAEIFKLLEQNVAYKEILKLMQEKHSVDEDRIHADSCIFVRKLEQYQMIFLS